MMHRNWLAIALFFVRSACALGPSYAANGIVNASDFAAGPFAPNSVMAIFGTALARSTHALAADDLVTCAATLQATRCLPLEMNYVRVYVQDQAVPMLFTSPGQVNFLMPTTEIAGPVKVRLVTEGLTGPEIVVTLVDSAPALFSLPGGWAIVTDAAGKLLTPDAPAHSGDTVVVYITGLGRTSPNPSAGELPVSMATMLAFGSLTVTLNEKAVNRDLIKYAGLTPGCAGLYQINLYLPEGTGDDPEIRVMAGGPPPSEGLKIPLR